MSLPLRPALENVTSVDRVLEDLLVRFIINCPPEDLASVERELFHFEEASWFYIDFVKIINPTLPSLKIKSFAQNIIRLCPLVWKWDIKADEALQKFSKYKKSIPVRGAAIFNEKLNKVLLVQGTESDSWSFPRGKISKDEDDVACCIREVKEEIGFDLTDYIDENQFIERNIQGKNYKIFLVSGVPEDFSFKPQVRNEINKIEWRDFKKMSKSIYKSTVRYYLVNSMIRPLSMWLRRKKQMKGDDQLKQYAEEQLKLLLGITKEEQVDPGRELLNMLHSAVQSNEDQLGAPFQTQTPVAQTSEPWVQQTSGSPPDATAPPGLQQPYSQPLPALMGFQPFAPFQFINGGVPYLNPHMVHSNISQLPIPSMGPLPAPNSILPTPDASSLARPVIATQPEYQEKATSSKFLLDVLNTKRPSFSKPMIDETDLGNYTSSYSSSHPSNNSDSVRNISDSMALLNILKGPQNSKSTIGTDNNDADNTNNESDSIPQNLIVNDGQLSFSESDNDNLNEEDDSYEDFEESSEEEETREDIAEKEDDTKEDEKKEAGNDFAFEEENSDDGFDYEEFESDSEVEEEQKVQDIQKEETPAENSLDQEALKTNNFKGDDVPHQDERTESAKSVENAQIGTENPKPKPKFKLLKRGENLEDVLTTIDNKVSTGQINTKESVSTIDVNVQKPTFTPSHSLSGIIRGAPPPVVSEQTQSISSKQESPEEELTSMLKKSHQGITKQSATVNTGGCLTPSADLLSILKKAPANDSKQQNHQSLDNCIPPANNHNASAELLGLLKHPMNGNVSPVGQNSNSMLQQGFFNDSFQQTELHSNIPASNELLNILHRK